MKYYVRFSDVQDKNNTVSFDFDGYIDSGVFVLTDYQVFIFANDDWTEVKGVISTKKLFDLWGETLIKEEIKRREMEVDRIIA